MCKHYATGWKGLDYCGLWYTQGSWMQSSMDIKVMLKEGMFVECHYCTSSPFACHRGCS
jgi:hypothetical protein